MIVALLYSIGAHGIMTLNDFKSVEGDRQTGLASLPVDARRRPGGASRLLRHGAAAGWWSSVLLLAWGFPIHAIIVVILLGGQALCMARMLTDPLRCASWYNATGTTMYVFGMLACAFAIRAMQGG